MLKDFKALRERVGAGEPKTVAVACAHDAHTLEAVLHAASEGILRYILVGHRDEIIRIGRELGHEIDPKTMASKKIEGLYFSGEIIDCDAYTGGYNLQIAWATAFAAGKAVAENRALTNEIICTRISQ